MSAPGQIALAAVWGLVVIFVLADLGEDVRGDSYLLRAIPWDFVGGVAVSGAIIGIDVLARIARHSFSRS